jgi:hypothetical protein
MSNLQRPDPWTWSTTPLLFCCLISFASPVSNCDVTPRRRTVTNTSSNWLQVPDRQLFSRAVSSTTYGLLISHCGQKEFRRCNWCQTDLPFSCGLTLDGREMRTPQSTLDLLLKPNYVSSHGPHFVSPQKFLGGFACNVADPKSGLREPFQLCHNWWPQS